MVMLNTWDLLQLSVQPVGEVILLCGLGAWLAHPRINIFPAEARNFVNKLVFLVFLPALVFAELGQAVTFERMIRWWFMPLNVLLVFFIGGGVGYLVVHFCKPPKEFHRLVIACCSTGNVGNLLLVLIYGVCSDPDNPFGEEASCREQGVAYITYGMWMATLLMWTVLYNYLKPEDKSLPLTSDPAEKGGGIVSSNNGGLTAGLVKEGSMEATKVRVQGPVLSKDESRSQSLGAAASERADLQAGGLDAQEKGLGETGGRLEGRLGSSEAVLSQWTLGKHSNEDSANQDKTFDLRNHRVDHSEDAKVGFPTNEGPQSKFQTASEKEESEETLLTSAPSKSEFSESLAVAGGAASADLRIQIKRTISGAAAWMREKSSEYDKLNPEPLSLDSPSALSRPRFDWSVIGLYRLAYKSMKTVRLKDIFTPPTTAAAAALLVGVVPQLKALFFGPDAPLQTVTHTMDLLGGGMIPCMMLVLGGNLSQGPGENTMGVQTLVGIMSTRFIFLPLIGFCLIPLVGLLGGLPPADPMFRLVLLLQFAMPPAINIGTLAQLHGVGEREASLILFWSYLLCAIPLAGFMMAVFAVLF